MNKSIFGVVGFVLGAAAGSFVTWKLIEKKYMDMADEEIQSVKEMYLNKIIHATDEETPDISNRFAEDDKSRIHYESDEINEEPTNGLNELVVPYTSSDDKSDYTAYSQAKQIEKTIKQPEPEVTHDDPYVIDPTEFGEFSAYEQRELTYYKDGIICENDTDIVDEVDIFGDLDVGDHFGEYENDRVFVRDDKRQVDYEILRDERTFMEAL